jgi:hypothetical protein
MGRPAKDIDAELVRKLAKLGCTQDEIADFFGVTQSVISERFRSDFHLGCAESKISIRRMQIKRAMQGSDRMLIHLGKVYLGQTDRVDVTSQGKSTVVYIEAANNPRDRLTTDLESALEAYGYVRKADNPRDTELDGWAHQYVRAKADRLERQNRINGAALHLGDNELCDATVILLPAKEAESVQ